MGVADGVNPMGARAVVMGEERLKDRLRLTPGRLVVLPPDVAEAVQLGEQLPGPALVQPALVLGLEALEKLEVTEEPPSRLVEEGDLAAVDQALRAVLGVP